LRKDDLEEKQRRSKTVNQIVRGGLFGALGKQSNLRA